MIFWCLVLLLFSFLSLQIDSGRLPYYIFRHLWNLIIVGFSLSLLIRTRNKESLGFLERLESQIEDITGRINIRKSEVVDLKLEKLEERVKKLEEKS